MLLSYENAGTEAEVYIPCFFTSPNRRHTRRTCIQKILSLNLNQGRISIGLHTRCFLAACSTLTKITFIPQCFTYNFLPFNF